MAAPFLKLIYLDHHYWRAECSRVALFMADVLFENARIYYNVRLRCIDLWHITSSCGRKGSSEPDPIYGRVMP